MALALVLVFVLVMVVVVEEGTEGGSVGILEARLLCRREEGDE